MSKIRQEWDDLTPSHDSDPDWKQLQLSDLAGIVERAILAERERCAGIARTYADQFPEYPEFDEGFNVASEIETLILAVP